MFNPSLDKILGRISHIWNKETRFVKRKREKMFDLFSLDALVGQDKGKAGGKRK